MPLDPTDDAGDARERQIFHELVLTSTEVISMRRFEVGDLPAGGVGIFEDLFELYGHDRFLAEIPVSGKTILEFHWRRSRRGRSALGQFYCRGALLSSALFLKPFAIDHRQQLRALLRALHEQAGGNGSVQNVDLLPQPRPQVIALPWPNPRCMSLLPRVGWFTRCLMAAFLRQPVPSR